MERENKQISCRESQYEELGNLFSQYEDGCWPAVFITGPAATGKSSVCADVLKNSNVLHAWISCSECFSVRVLCETIHAEISHVLGKELAAMKQNNIYELVFELRELLANTKRLVLVLDSATYLLRLEPRVLAALLRLHEWGLPLVVVLVSELPWEKFRFSAAGIEPVIVDFPAYSLDELVRIISRDVSDQSPSRDFYVQYVRLFCSVFVPVCRDVRQLQHQTQLHFSKYVEPVLKGEVKADDSMRLWRSFEGVLRRALKTVYLGELSSSQWTDHLSATDEGAMPVLLSRHQLELPLYSKYLLIAGFLASYNPASSDKRFFLKGSDKNVRKKRITKRGDRTSNLVLGPKAFPLDRLIAIFRTIAETGEPFSVAVAAQVSSLVSLGLMTQLSSIDRLDTPRYKCLATLEFIRSLSRNVRFSLDEYLYDLVIKAS